MNAGDTSTAASGKHADARRATRLIYHCLAECESSYRPAYRRIMFRKSLFTDEIGSIENSI